jgi:hypothetical protein
MTVEEAKDCIYVATPLQPCSKWLVQMSEHSSNWNECFSVQLENDAVLWRCHTALPKRELISDCKRAYSLIPLTRSPRYVCAVETINAISNTEEVAQLPMNDECDKRLHQISFLVNRVRLSARSCPCCSAFLVLPTYVGMGATGLSGRAVVTRCLTCRTYWSYHEIKVRDGNEFRVVAQCVAQGNI